jgi:non-heme chloroperoxidase
MIRYNKLTGVFLVVFTFVIISALATPSNADTPPATKSGFVVTSDGVRIHYLEAGQVKTVGSFEVGGTPQHGALINGQVSISDIRQQPAILFVPGWTMPGWIWEKQIEHFSKTHRVVAMDPRCQGESSQTADGLSPAARARDIKAVVDQLHLAPVILVGWSMGVGEVASYVDQFGTKDIAGIVFVDDVPGADVPAAVYKDVMEFINGFVQNRRGATEPFVRSFFKKPQPEDYLKRVVEASLRTPTNTAVALLVGKFGTDLRPALKKIDKPTLIVAAKSGFLNLIQAIQPQIAGSRLEIFEDAGHALFVDDAERFNSLLDEFLRSLR